MTEKELQKLTRQDLLELLLEAERENESLRDEVETLRAEAADKRLLLGKVGSIAEASLLVNGVFSAAQAAADQYVLNVKRVCEEKAEQVRSADNIVLKAQEEARKLRAETEDICRKMIRQAKEESDRYWEAIRLPTDE
ncbi:MAG: hypothetical protein IKO83_06480 [Oscillospiraceae bacterium]|nr:hypothetical protein [Oscillospiraceae bacterium]